MRKGISLIELIVVLGVLTAASIPLARLTRTTLRDIPKSLRIIESGKTIANALRRLREDVNVAEQFPASFGKYTSGAETLLINRGGQILCWQLKPGELIRRSLGRADGAEDEELAIWTIPNGRIRWRIWREDGAGYAVEIVTHVEQKTPKSVKKKMEFTYLFFAGVYQQPQD